MKNENLRAKKYLRSHAALSASKFIYVFALIIISHACIAQYQIGHTTITFNDPTRTGGYGSGGGPGRQIQTEIYYPANVAGEDVAVIPPYHPVVICGHGFAMSWDAYENVWESLVPLGYILAFPRTEGSLFPSPSHEEFAQDLLIVEQKLIALHSEPTSIFYDHVFNRSAIIGHSMGGGCTILAGAVGSVTLKTIVGFAPAETSPSAIADASAVTVPALIFSGSSDGVTPPVDHHLPIYNALGSACKFFVSIDGGAHCYFANTNFNCDFGESTSSTGISVTREEQQEKTMSLLIPWLDFYLHENCDAYNAFEDSLSSVGGITTQQQCTYSPFDVTAVITGETLGNDGSIDQTVSGGIGTYTFDWFIGATTEDLTGIAGGTYSVYVGDGYCKRYYEYFVSSLLDADENLGENILIYPNPVSDVLRVEVPENLINLEVISIDGRVLSVPLLNEAAGIYELDISTLSVGTYILKLTDENSATRSFSFVVK
ncbi:MAG: T9SS type A sorting domain-containing protein [Crocinitomicaceae bacterium]|nr:T9SS type A sorting domain-containing protein [Crocinitomicaceae bacterium]MBK8925113.1 T9SS type A sorting domain-containing protein [Crocinitomicaceae bacterium]